MEHIKYTYPEFMEDCEELERLVLPYIRMDLPNLRQICAIPRGGYIPGVCLAHRLSGHAGRQISVWPPAIFTSVTVGSKDPIIIIDDIYDKGTTITQTVRHFKKLGYVRIIGLALLSRVVRDEPLKTEWNVNLLHARAIDTHSWVDFWWG